MPADMRKRGPDAVSVHGELRTLRGLGAPRRRNTLTTGLHAVLILFISVTAGSGAERLANRRIPTDLDGSLRFPASADRVISFLQSALFAAGVPSGIEQAPPGGDDLENVLPQGPAVLSVRGRTVGEALDAFVALDPRYRWSESGGRIFLKAERTNGTAGLLDKRLGPLTLRRSTMPDALAVLARLALSHEHRVMTVHYPPLKASAIETRTEPLVTFSLQEPSLLEALNAISKAAGNLSWLVRYRTAAASAEVATVSFVALDRSWSAFPPGSLSFEPRREAQRSADGPGSTR